MKKMLALLLAAMVVLTMLTPVASAGETDTGFTFSADPMYSTTKALGAIPLTYEATLRLPEGKVDRSGVIMGNYGANPCLNFEISDNGRPRIYYSAPGESAVSWVFNQVNVCTGDWVHVALAWDTQASEMHCYVDGELKQTLSTSGVTFTPSASPMVLGGDMRGGNSMYFKGELRSVALYSNMRTATEIKADMTTLDKSGLIVGYDLNGLEQGVEIIPDLSDNNLDARLPITASMGGMTFEVDERYEMIKALDVMPKTFEAKIYVPETMAARAGVIVGNYGIVDCVNFEINGNGVPRFYSTQGSLLNDIQFTEVDVRTGDWVHLVIVRDTENRQFHCYLDGELKQTLALESGKAMTEVICNTPMILGSDQRLDNTQYFKGSIDSVALYSDIRTADEIKADAVAQTPDQSDLILAYDVSDVAENVEVVADLSGNGYDAKRQAVSTELWLTESPAIAEYDYSFAVVGDTQVLAQKYPEKFTALYDWLVANAEAKNMKYVLGLGDITETNVDVEWQLAKTNISKLNGVVPYSLVRGNHDGSAKMNEYFAVDDYSDKVFSYDGKIENTWRELRVGESSYLIMTLDYGASDAVLQWAGEVIDDHPYHNVIITTHAYMFRDGTTLDQNDVCPPATTGGYNNGDHIWEKFASQHKNIVMVLSGHDPCDYVVVNQDQGVHGNTVTQMLIDPQGTDAGRGGVGMVAMFYFSNGGKTVQVEYYSTDKQQCFLAKNQFTMEIDVVKTPTVEETISMIAALPESVTLEATEAIQTAAAAYGVLTAEQQAQVTNSDKLIAARDILADLLAEKADTDAVNAVIAAIDDIQVHTYSHIELKSAQAAYDALREELRTSVTNYEKLQQAQTEHTDLLKQSETVLSEEMANKPVVPSVDTSWLISSFDSTADVNNPGRDQRFPTVNGDETFMAYYSQDNNTKIMTLKKSPDVSISDYTLDELVFYMQVYVENLDGMGVNGQLELTSSGACDQAEIHWLIPQLGLQEGWNEVYLPFSDAVATNGTQGAFDLSNINYFRFYFVPVDNVVLAFDQAMIIPAESVETILSDKEAAQPIIEQINALPETVTLDDEAAVVDARTAYEALTDNQKDYVGNYDKLIALENQIVILPIINPINALPPVEELTLEDEDAVKAARAAYDALSDEQKAMVSNLYKLEAAETRIAALKAADAVGKLIDALPDLDGLTLEDEDAVNAAYDAYLALTDGQKELLGEERRIKIEALKQYITPIPDIIVYGDINGDGEKNAADALLALQHSVQLTKLEGDVFTAADVDKTGEVNASDALYILQYSVKLIEKFPAEQ